MANQLDIVGAAGKKPYYDFIDLSEFRPELSGKVRVRVNPSRAIRKRIDAAHKEREAILQERAKPEAEQSADLAAREQALGQEFNTLAASLIPATDTGDEPITVEQLDAFIEGNDETDDTLQRWFLQEVWTKVYAYFLSPLTLRDKLTVGKTP